MKQFAKRTSRFFIGGLAQTVILSNSEAMLNSRSCKSKQGAVRFLGKESYVLCFVIRFNASAKRAKRRHWKDFILLQSLIEQSKCRDMCRAKKKTKEKK